MASAKAPASLTSLPTELLLSIVNDLTYQDLQALRTTSHFFAAVLPPASKSQLLQARAQAKLAGHTLIACAGCFRLIPHVRFSTKMLIRRRKRTSVQALNSTPGSSAASEPSSHSVISPQSSSSHQYEMFCNKCGCRPLPGTYRYQRGEVWDIEKGLWFLRCKKCGLCEQTSSVLLDDKRRRKPEELCRRCFKQEEKMNKVRSSPESHPRERSVPPPVPARRAVTQ